MSIWYLLLLCICTYSLPLFEYDRAVASAQCDQWSQAINLFNNLIAQQPNKADLLYDAGVAAFKHEDFTQAKAYFQESAENKDASRQLKAQAYFNKGNTHVALNELKEALSSYQQTLLLFPEDERAQHNYEIIKKMLEQQEQQQKEQEQQNQKQDKQDQQDEQKNQDQKNNDQSKQDDSSSSDQDQSNTQESSSDKDQSKDAADNNQKKERDQGEREHEGLDQERDEQNDQQSGTEQEQNQSQDQEQRDKGGKPEQGSEDDKKEEQQNRDHESPLQDELQQQDMKDAQKEQEQAAEEQEEELQEEQELAESVPLNPRLQQILQKRGDRDAALNKQMIKALVSQEMKGQHGQNCW